MQHDPFNSSNLNPNPIPIPNPSPIPIPNQDPFYSSPVSGVCTAHRYFRFKTLGSAAAGAGFEWCVRVRVRVRIRVSVRVRARVRVEVGASVSVRALVSSGASRGSNPATLYPCNPTSRRLQQPFACPGCNLGC